MTIEIQLEDAVSRGIIARPTTGNTDESHAQYLFVAGWYGVTEQFMLERAIRQLGNLDALVVVKTDRQSTDPRSRELRAIYRPRKHVIV